MWVSHGSSPIVGLVGGWIFAIDLGMLEALEYRRTRDEAYWVGSIWNPGVPDQWTPEELGRGISSSSELGFEHGDHGWKYLDENNVIETPNGGFGIVKENEFMMPHPLKENLGVGCVTSTHNFEHKEKRRNKIKNMLTT
jgi:hypothetical protein